MRLDEVIVGNVYWLNWTGGLPSNGRVRVDRKDYQFVYVTFLEGPRKGESNGGFFSSSLLSMSTTAPLEEMSHNLRKMARILERLHIHSGDHEYFLREAELLQLAKKTEDRLFGRS